MLFEVGSGRNSLLMQQFLDVFKEEVPFSIVSPLRNFFLEAVEYLELHSNEVSPTQDRISEFQRCL